MNVEWRFDERRYFAASVNPLYLFSVYGKKGRMVYGGCTCVRTQGPTVRAWLLSRTHQYNSFYTTMQQLNGTSVCTLFSSRMSVSSSHVPTVDAYI